MVVEREIYDLRQAIATRLASIAQLCGEEEYDWAIGDAEEIGKLAEKLAEKLALLADGHHEEAV